MAESMEIISCDEYSFFNSSVKIFEYTVRIRRFNQLLLNYRFTSVKKAILQFWGIFFYTVNIRILFSDLIKLPDDQLATNARNIMYYVLLQRANSVLYYTYS